ncbi:MAG: Gfo/Idh/MocA family oxidoreductase [Crenarchaeota archaeon]|nr:Gfo/Idh/MocA family oxidoreductase [Thermoproteota archaeon]MDW8033360.1 Gfo/Idh/MocA family oxidoreductase [Nitrososphaerota archaeon]
MGKKPSVIVVGAGGFGKNHVRVLAELGSLGGVCDIDREKASTYGKLYNVPYYLNVSDIPEGAYDGAIVSTPTSTHKDVAMQIASKEIGYIFIEKPFTPTLKEAIELIEFLKRKNVKIMVGFIERFNPAVKMVKKYVDEEALGEIIMASATRVRRWPERIIDSGVLLDTAIHDVDLMRYLFSEEPIKVYAKTGKSMHRIHEDYATILLTFQSGKMALINANWLTPFKIRSIEVIGSEGVVEADLVTQQVTLSSKDDRITPFSEWREPLRYELKHFLDCITSNEKPNPDERDALKALEIIEASLKSSKTGNSVEVST